MAQKEGMSSTSKAMLGELFAIVRIIKAENLRTAAVRQMAPHLQTLQERIAEVDKELVLAHQLVDTMRAAGWDVPTIVKKLTPKETARLRQIGVELNLLNRKNAPLVEHAHALNRERDKILGVAKKHRNA
jgi:hypothetical protein